MCLSVALGLGLDEELLSAIPEERGINQSHVLSAQRHVPRTAWQLHVPVGMERHCLEDCCWSREGRTTPGFLAWGFLPNWLVWVCFFPTSCPEKFFLKKIPWFSPSVSNLLDEAQLPSVSVMTGVIKRCCRLASGLMWVFFNYLLSIEG